MIKFKDKSLANPHSSQHHEVLKESMLRELEIGIPALQVQHVPFCPPLPL